MNFTEMINNEIKFYSDNKNKINDIQISNAFIDFLIK